MACCRKRSQFKSSLLPAPIAVSQVYTRAKILRKSIVDCLGEMTFSFEVDSSEVIFPFIGSPFFVPFIYRTGSALFCCMFLQKKIAKPVAVPAFPRQDGSIYVALPFSGRGECVRT